jgi:hypothetical protein
VGRLSLLRVDMASSSRRQGGLCPELGRERSVVKTGRAMPVHHDGVHGQGNDKEDACLRW